ncbi:MAG: YifB family Mg chelatase-like AAA ATPase [Nannocystaceae bacterium]
MLARAHSASIVGVEGIVVIVEASVGLGLPCLTLVGRASGAVMEARERVKSALGHCGHGVPPRKQVVNLAPADERKESPGIDLAVACALLAAHGVIQPERLDGLMFWGELALDGVVRPASGTLIVAESARAAGFRAIAVARASAIEASYVPGLEVLPVDDLRALCAHLRGERAIDPQPTTAIDEAAPIAAELDMADVRGLALARRAIEAMVAGGHNLLLHGPPGVGKTMLARRAAALFPPLDAEAALTVTKIHGVAGLARDPGLVTRPPFRAPHHTVSVAGLLGGGQPLRPGEVSLAHRGLLFLDELPEYGRGCLEGLREPLEDGHVHLVRARGALRLPARFQLMAAMNPCPCGYLGHPDRTCTDSPGAVQRYQERLSGPLLDRLDLVVPVHAASAEELSQKTPSEPSTAIRARIEGARARQRRRLHGTRWRSNAEIPAHGDTLDRLIPLTSAAERLLTSLAARRSLSPRAQHRLRRLARTLVDLDAAADPEAPDRPLGAEVLAEAAHLRRMPEHSRQA